MQRPSALYSVAEIRAIERTALAALPPFSLMQRAGEAAAKLAQETCGERLARHGAVILAGPGNNGGDALVAASRLAQSGLAVSILHFADAAHLSGDANQALALAKSSAAQFHDPMQHARLLQERPQAVVIDGLFGIGLSRPLDLPFRDVIELVNRSSAAVIALDVPSGLDADTGNVVGTDSGGVALRADHTITFIGDKTGLHTGSGRDYAGQVHVANLDIGSSHFVPPHAWLGEPAVFANLLRPRAHNSHKGSYGNAVIVGGAEGMSGAAILAGRAAIHCGAGRVYVAFVGPAPAVDPLQPELMCRDVHADELPAGVRIVGPGLGVSAFAHDALAKALHAETPLVLDADALNMIAADPALHASLKSRSVPALITPHPLEAARLLGKPVAEVQSDRLAAARALAAGFNAVAILKGSGSVIARPDGTVAINASGNAALATAGTGDVLAGICGALLAQSLPVWEAAVAATWLHGHAADMLVEKGVGPVGVTAGELIEPVRAALNRLIADAASA